jgi:hypothetical protein
MRVRVTICAPAGGILEGSRAMAFLTGNGSMQTYEGESRQIMVKCNILTPAFLVVALVTVAAELSFMGVVLAVA